MRMQATAAQQHLITSFDNLNPNNLTCDHMRRSIQKIYDMFNITTHMRFAADTINYITELCKKRNKLECRWNSTFYFVEILGKNKCVPVFWCSVNTYTYFVDVYGNYFSHEKKLISFWNVSRYFMYNNLNRYIDLSDFAFLLTDCLSYGFNILFRGCGGSKIHDFIAVWRDIDAEIILRRIKIIYPFFLTFVEQPEVNFEVDTAFKVKLGLRSYEVDLGNLEHDFDHWEDTVRNHSETMAFTKECYEVLKDLRDDRELKFVDNLPDEEFQRHFYKTSSCYEIAGQILIKINDEEYKKPINLPKFKNIILWVKYKVSLDYYLSKTKDDYDFTDLSNQFYRLIWAVRDFRESFIENQHSFPSDYSSAYHTNAHFDGLKNFELNKIPFLQDNMMLNAIRDFNSKSDAVKETSMTHDINILDIEDKLDDCMRFYLQQVPNFLFNVSIYTKYNEAHGYKIIPKGEDENMYIAEYRVKGCKRQFGEQIFVTTIHLLKHPAII